MRLWLNGRLDDVSALRISPLDHGILVGDGVFETLRAYGGVPFVWRRHHERLVLSAHGIGLEVPSSSSLRHAADAVLAANDLREARLRITVTGGESPLGSERGDAEPTVIVAASELAPPAPDADVVTVPWSRNERSAIAGLKTISYAENVRALAYAREHGAIEAVFPNSHGDLCEATGSNVFLVFQRVLHTPPGEAGCLLGVTRGADPRARGGARHPDRGGGAATRRVTPVRRGLPLVDHARGPGHRPRRRPAAAGRVRSDHRQPRHRLHRSRRPRPEPLSAGSGVAEVHHVACRDRVRRAVNLHEQPA